MSTGEIRRPLEADPLAAARRLGGDALLLHGGGRGWSVLAPIGERIALRTWADLNALPSKSGERRAGSGDAGGDGWGVAGPGAWIVQLDYEFPSVTGRAWRVDTCAVWSPDGVGVVVGTDTVSVSDLHRRLSSDFPAPRSPLPAPALRPAWDLDGHRSRVQDLRRRIAAGEIYQANLTLPFAATVPDAAQRAWDIGLRLLERSPAAYGCLLRDGDRTVASHSPECLLRRRGDDLLSRPIKGTRRREPGRDAAARAELLASPKERAELAMIVDLVRNDLGRVAVAGSVRVAEAARIADLPYVHHLVAEIVARRRPGAGDGALVEACFPPGSVTGCPKLRAMQVLADCEAGPRGAYCGSVGLVHADAADWSVAIRTLVGAGDRLACHAGGGITADSDPDAEWDEVQAKASALLAAVAQP